MNLYKKLLSTPHTNLKCPSLSQIMNLNLLWIVFYQMISDLLCFWPITVESCDLNSTLWTPDIQPHHLDSHLWSSSCPGEWGSDPVVVTGQYCIGRIWVHGVIRWCEKPLTVFFWLFVLSIVLSSFRMLLPLAIESLLTWNATSALSVKSLATCAGFYHRTSTGCHTIASCTVGNQPKNAAPGRSSS